MHSGKPLVKWIWTERPPHLARLLAAGCADLWEGALLSFLSPGCPPQMLQRRVVRLLGNVESSVFLLLLCLLLTVNSTEPNWLLQEISGCGFKGNLH